MKTVTIKINDHILAIGAIILLELIALYKGINGTALSLSIAAIAGLGGYSFAKWRENKE